jgi:hypothetical protein
MTHWLINNAPCKQRINNGHFPLNKFIIVEEQGQSAEHGDQDERDQRHFFDFAIANPAVDQHNGGRNDQRSGRGINVVQLIKAKKTTSGKKSRNCFIL